MDRALLERHLAAAERHVADGERTLARQRGVIATLERRAHDTREGGPAAAIGCRGPAAAIG